MKFGQQVTEIYFSAARAYYVNFVAVLLFSFMLHALWFVKEALTSAGRMSFVTIAFSIVIGVLLKSSFAYSMHKIVLSRDTVKLGKTKYTRSNFEAFLWRSVFIAMAVFLMIIPLTNYLVTVESLSNRTIAYVSLGYFVIIITPLSSLFMALFGTILPAIVDEGDISFRAAYRRSRGQVLRVLIQLIIGPAFTYLVILVISNIIDFIGIPTEMFTLDGQLDPVGTIISVLHTMAVFYATTLGVVILCKAYLNATPQTDNP